MVIAKNPLQEKKASIYGLRKTMKMKNKLSDTLHRFAGKGLYPPNLAWVLLIPFRNLYLSPAKLASRLELKKDSTVLEIGCGPGYFSPHIARRIPEGKLYLTDIQNEMLGKAKSRLLKYGIANFDIKPCDGNSLEYPDAFFDSIFLVTVLGEISNQTGYAAEMFRILKPGGILSISEQGGDPDALSLDEVKNILLPAGFQFKHVFGKRRTYTANFTKG